MPDRTTSNEPNEVLLVDDDTPVRHALARGLARAGFRVIEATHAEDALRVWDRDSASIGSLVADMRLPGRSGHALAVELAAKKPSLRVVLVSGLDSDSVQHLTGDTLEFTFLRKPFPIGDLVNALTE